MPVRGLSPQQLFDSLAQATGLRREADQPFRRSSTSARRGSDFLEMFANHDEKPTERQTSILQALTLMNGRLIADATSLEPGGTLPAVAEAPFLDTPGQIEALYLAALTRRPTARGARAPGRRTSNAAGRARTPRRPWPTSSGPC